MTPEGRFPGWQAVRWGAPGPVAAKPRTSFPNLPVRLGGERLSVARARDGLENLHDIRIKEAEIFRPGGRRQEIHQDFVPVAGSTLFHKSDIRSREARHTTATSRPCQVASRRGRMRRMETERRAGSPLRPAPARNPSSRRRSTPPSRNPTP